MDDHDDHEVIVTFTFHAMAEDKTDAIRRAMNYFKGAGTASDLYPITVEVTCEDK